MSKPRVVISKCLEFAPCRWNGLRISSEVVRQLKDYVDFIPVCPEVEIGLGVPRDPVRLIEKQGKILIADSDTGEDFSIKMRDFSRVFLESLGQVHGFILKNRSPSCGLNGVKVYPSPGKVQSLHSNGVGFFANPVQEVYSHLAIEDEGRLLNMNIREHFLTKLFCLHDLLSLEKSVGSMVEFHSKNKYLFMSYNQEVLKKAGKVLANHTGKGKDDVFREYYQCVCQILSRLPRNTSNVNVLLHIFGYFSKKINNSEKVLFLDYIEAFRNRQLPLVALTSILKTWAVRFEDKYLMKQNYLNPFPNKLKSIFDTGRGRFL